MLTPHRSPVGITKLFLLAALLLGAIFLVPDAGQLQHKSFLSVAWDSPWTQPLDWSAVWCSTKIVVLSACVFLVLEAVLSVMMRTGHPTACMALLVLSIVPASLGCFGFYELIKAFL